MVGKDEAEFHQIINVIIDDDIPEIDRISVSNLQTMCTDEYSSPNDLQYSGSCVQSSYVNHQPKDVYTVSQWKSSARKSGQKIPSLDFLQISEEPIHEYDGSSIFAHAFPWLFPGGVGDFYDIERGEHRNVSL